MHINRGLLFWGLTLVTAGVVALAATQGWIDIPAMAELWNLWPVILIVIGLAIVLSRTPFAVIGVIVAALVVGFAGGAVIAAGAGGFGTCGDVQGAQDTANGEFTSTTASVDLDMNCGDLTVGLADGSAWQAVTTTGGEQHVSLEADSGSLADPLQHRRLPVQRRSPGLDRHPGPRRRIRPVAHPQCRRRPAST